MTYWILTSHLASIFPISVYTWSYRNRKDVESLFMLLQTIFIVTFSIFYHTYHVSDINIEPRERPVWTFLDHSQSTISIITTVIYCLRVKPPYFYVYSYVVQMLILMLHLFKHYHLSIYTLIVCSSIAAVIKWFTIFRYLKFYKILCTLVIICGISSTICFFTAVNADDSVYIPYHSMWHLSIFMTAGFGSLLRLKLENKLYPILRGREQVTSIDSLADIELEEKRI
jgi:hypothetical protein